MKSFLKNDLPKKYNQKTMFKEIIAERTPFSELSYKPLYREGHWQWHWQFLHILPKGTYPELKLFKGNIILGLPEEHDKQEQYEEFQERKQLLRDVYREIKSEEFY